MHCPEMSTQHRPRVTPAQLNVLLSLEPDRTHLTRGIFGNVCATLCKSGLVEFRGYEAGLRKFAITAAGRAVTRRARFSVWLERSKQSGENQ